MKRFSLRALLLLLAIVPLAAFVVVCSLTTWGYYDQFASFRTATVVQRLANAGAKLALAMPEESRATAEARSQRRVDTDRAFAAIAAIYQQWKASGQSDATIENDVHFLMDRRETMKAFRAHVDAGVGDAARKGSPFFSRPAPPVSIWCGGRRRRSKTSSLRALSPDTMR